MPEWTIQRVHGISDIMSQPDSSYKGRHCINCNEQMSSKKIRKIAVFENDKIIGIITSMI